MQSPIWFLFDTESSMSSPLISQNEVEAKSSDVSSVQKDRLKYVLHIIISVHISVTKPFCFPWLSKILDPRKYLTALLSSSWSSDLGAGLEIPWSRFQVPLWPPAGFVPCTPGFNCMTAHVQSHQVHLLRFRILNLLSLFELSGDLWPLWNHLRYYSQWSCRIISLSKLSSETSFLVRQEKHCAQF